MESFLQDVRHGMRVFYRSPLLVITIVVTLSLGMRRPPLFSAW